MTTDDVSQEIDPEGLSPKELTDRLQSLQAGDRFAINDRQVVLEVTGTDRYAIEAEDERGNEYTISQNLQTGGWSVHEPVQWVSSVNGDDAVDP